MRVRTIFNILGPLTNPAGARRQVLGVADSALASKMIESLRELGSVHALVVHGEDGLDEITLSGPSMVYELKDGKISRYEICPEQFGFRSSSTQSLRGGDRETNADITRKVLTGTTGPARDVVLINAAAGLVAADVAENLKEGLEIAARVIDEGAAMEKLDAFIGATHRFAEEN